MDRDIAFAGLAHDLNNVLQTVAQVADLLSTDRHWTVESDLLMRCVDRGRSILESLQEEASVVNLRAVALRAIGGLEGLRVELAIEDGLAFEGKPLALERALLNLLWNSARAGATEVRIAGSRGPAVCVIEVADNGPGIAEADLQRVFETGFSTTASTGLGLKIVEWIIHSHKGSICVSNRGGACFEIRIPL